MWRDSEYSLDNGGGKWEMYPVRTMGWLRKVCSSVVNMLEKENNGDREQWEPRVATVLST